MKGKRVIAGILLVGILATALAGCKNADVTKKEKVGGVPIMVQQKGIRLGTMRLWVQSLGDCSVSWGFGIAMSCGVGHRCSWDPVLLWLWYRPAVVALIQPLAWESPYVVGAALKSKKKKKE